MKIVQFRDGTYGVRKFNIGWYIGWMFLTRNYNSPEWVTDSNSKSEYDKEGMKDVKQPSIDLCLNLIDWLYIKNKREMERKKKPKLDIGRPIPILKPAKPTPPAPSCSQCKCKHN